MLIRACKPVAWRRSMAADLGFALLQQGMGSTPRCLGVVT